MHFETESCVHVCVCVCMMTPNLSIKWLLETAKYEISANLTNWCSEHLSTYYDMVKRDFEQCIVHKRAT